MSKKSKGKFVVFDGTDGSGKSTQMTLLLEKLTKLKVKFKTIKFPRYDDNPYGQMVAAYLRGEFGSMYDIDHRLIALMYAGDRALAKPLIEGWLNKGYLVISDRYVSSNQAFTAGRIDHKLGQEFIKWDDNLEFEVNKLPRPDMSVLLYVDPKVSHDNVAKKDALKDGRTYLNSKQRDIHEDDLEYQSKVAKAYLNLAKHDPKWHVVKCMQGQNMRSREEIHEEILESLKEKGFI